MKTKRVMRSTITAMALLVLAGCYDDREEFSRYPSVQTILFSAEDYAAQLSGKNPEVVYNAICSLGFYAKELGDALWKKNKKPDAESEAATRTAQTVYSDICALLDSDEPMITAASLRFLQLFAKGHDQRTELIEPVCRIKSSNPLVQFEQVQLLKRLTDGSAALPEPLMHRLLNSKSWIVSRSTYELIGMFPDEPLRKELIARYRAATDEQEKLLLLFALGEHAGPEEIELSQQEALSSESQHIRTTATWLLMDSVDEPGVLPWIVDHFEQLIPPEEDDCDIFEIVYDSDEPGQVTRYLLERGCVPGDDFLEELNGRLEQKPGEIPPCVLQIEAALITEPEVAARWQPIRQKTEELKQRTASLSEALKPLKEEYMAQMKSVLTKHGVPDEVQQKYLKQIPGLNARSVIKESTP